MTYQDSHWNQIKDIQETDAGKYQCQVLLTVTEKINADVAVSVRIPPIIFDNSTRSVVVSEGEAIKLECYAGGFPAPRVLFNFSFLLTGRSCQVCNRRIILSSRCLGGVKIMRYCQQVVRNIVATFWPFQVSVKMTAELTIAWLKTESAKANAVTLPLRWNSPLLSPYRGNYVCSCSNNTLNGKR